VDVGIVTNMGVGVGCLGFLSSYFRRICV